MGEPVLAFRHVSKSYRGGETEVDVLKDIGCAVEAGELVILLGRSGSGKTTFLSLAGGVDRPDSGCVVLDGLDITAQNDAALARLRAQKVGWMFQSSGLLPLLTAVENVGLALRILGEPPRRASDSAHEALQRVGMEDRAEHRAYELSGGEQQRVALARSLVKRPRLLLADEPTGHLDSETGTEVATLLRQLAGAEVAVLLATHDPSLIELADRVFTLEDGQLQEG